MALLGLLGQLAPTSERPSYDGFREPYQWLSHPHPFEIELTGLLLEGWIFATPERLKDPSAGLATVALDTPAGAIANRVKMSTVRTLHR